MKTFLTTRQHSIGRLVKKAIHANPFTHGRHLANCELTGLAQATNAHTVLQEAIRRVEALIRDLEAQGTTALPTQNHSQRQALADIYLFYLFHRYLPHLDEHITAQAKTSKSLELACGPELCGEFTRLGFTSSECSRYIALFFQMRRAFFFIKNSLIGSAPCMEKLRASLWEALFTHDIGLYEHHLIGRLEDFSTLLLGETGTGKGLAAAAIGRSGFIPYERGKNRFAISFSRAFLAINLCQYPDSILESELFGHCRGAFTGAVRDHQGIFARASRHGAVFLDEIGEINQQVQVKLLRILQERTFTPVGSHVSNRFAGRLIGATNRDLEQMVEQGEFREDFYFRIATLPITLPSLRQRILENPDELGELIVFLAGKIVAANVGRTVCEQIKAEILNRDGLNYFWPGNVRELEQAVRSIVLTGKWKPRKNMGETGGIDLLASKANPPTMAELASRYCQALLKRHGTIQAVARHTGLDRRTVKKHLDRPETKGQKKAPRPKQGAGQ